MTQNLTYTRCGDYLIPDIQLSNTSNKPLGKYGRMRRAFLAENNPILLDDMILTETLFPHLWEIDETAHRRVKQIMTELLERNPAPDKSIQQLAWVQHMSIAIAIIVVGLFVVAKISGSQSNNIPPHFYNTPRITCWVIHGSGLILKCMMGNTPLATCI